MCHLALHAPVARELVSVSEIVLGVGRKASRQRVGLTTENAEDTEVRNSGTTEVVIGFGDAPMNRILRGGVEAMAHRRLSPQP